MKGLKKKLQTALNNKFPNWNANLGNVKKGKTPGCLFHKNDKEETIPDKGSSSNSARPNAIIKAGDQSNNRGRNEIVAEYLVIKGVLKPILNELQSKQEYKGISGGVPDVDIINTNGTGAESSKETAFLVSHFLPEFQELHKGRSKIPAVASKEVNDALGKMTPGQKREFYTFLVLRHIIADSDGHSENFGFYKNEKGETKVCLIDAGLALKFQNEVNISDNKFISHKFSEHALSPNHLALYSSAYSDPLFRDVLKDIEETLNKTETKAKITEAIKQAETEIKTEFGTTSLDNFGKEWCGFQKNQNLSNGILNELESRATSLETLVSSKAKEKEKEQQNESSIKKPSPKQEKLDIPNVQTKKNKGGFLRMMLHKAAEPSSPKKGERSGRS